MLLSRRNLLLIGLAAPLGACGFSPVYKTGAPARQLQGNIKIDLIDSREGFDLRERLQGLLGAATPDAPYALNIRLDITEEGLAISTANIATRFNVFGTAHIILRDLPGDEVFSAKLTSITAYGATTSTVGTTSARRDAYQRLAWDLAERINARLAATASAWLP